MNSLRIPPNPKKVPRPGLPETPVLLSDPSGHEAGLPGGTQSLGRTAVKGNGKRSASLIKDTVFTLRRNELFHIISENYAYKTETYYSILQLELQGKPVRPQSSTILDAYVVPLCLERARRAGIPVCSWGISQVYVPLPAILYGLNYFATTSDYFVVQGHDQATDAIKHLTNRGKYPFCYQKLNGDATVHSCIVIFGKTVSSVPPVALLAEKVYEHFAIPLFTMVLVNTGDRYFLSSLSPTKYSQLSPEERTLLAAYLSNQEFL